MLLADTQSVTLVQQMGTILQEAFGGDTPIEPLTLYQVAARDSLVYLAGLVVVRIGKSRLISRTTSLDVILGFILGSLLSRSITGHASISGTIVASAVIVAVHWADRECLPIARLRQRIQRKYGTTGGKRPRATQGDAAFAPFRSRPDRATACAASITCTR